jgi:hypothetical protein
MKSFRNFQHHRKRDIAGEGLRFCLRIKVHMPRVNWGSSMPLKVMCGIYCGGNKKNHIRGEPVKVAPSLHIVGLTFSLFHICSLDDVYVRNKSKVHNKCCFCLDVPILYFLLTFTCCILISHSAWVAQGSLSKRAMTQRRLLEPSLLARRTSSPEQG